MVHLAPKSLKHGSWARGFTDFFFSGLAQDQTHTMQSQDHFSHFGLEGLASSTRYIIHTFHTFLLLAEMYQNLKSDAFFSLPLLKKSLLTVAHLVVSTSTSKGLSDPSERL